MKHNNDIFERMPVPKAIAKNAIPAIINMIVIILYNIADTYFVGQTGNALQVAAVALTTPVFLLFMATGNLLGIGGTSVVSRALGAKKMDYAKHVSSFCFYSAIMLGIFFTVTFWIFMPLILDVIGTSEDTTKFARDYLNYIAPSAPFVIIATAFSNIVRAEGKSNKAVIGMMLGTIINIILDPVMILMLDMGVTGAAIATLIGNIVGTGYYLFYFFRGKTILSISLKDFKAGDRIMTGVFAIGVPAALNNVLMSISNIIMNNFLASYGDNAVAAMGIAMKIGMIVVLFQIGLGIGVQPLLGYCYGAQNKKRFLEIIKYSLLYCAILGVSLTAVCWFGAGSIIQAFINDDKISDYGVSFMKALLTAGPFLGFMFIFVNALQATGAATESLIISLSRQGLVFLPMLFIMNNLFGLSGLVYSQPAADFVSIFISGFLFFLKINKWGHTVE